MTQNPTIDEVVHHAMPQCGQNHTQYTNTSKNLVLSGKNRGHNQPRNRKKFGIIDVSFGLMVRVYPNLYTQDLSRTSCFQEKSEDLLAGTQTGQKLREFRKC